MADVHPAVQELVGALGRAGAAARAVSLSRFDSAMDHLQRGDEQYLVSVTLDSYHTIWFQLHEELIEMAGRTRGKRSDHAAQHRTDPHHPYRQPAPPGRRPAPGNGSPPSAASQATDEQIRDAVADTVRRQVAAGVDVVNDGEMSKPSYATYVTSRLTGFESMPRRRVAARGRRVPRVLRAPLPRHRCSAVEQPVVHRARRLPRPDAGRARHRQPARGRRRRRAPPTCS